MLFFLICSVPEVYKSFPRTLDRGRRLDIYFLMRHRVLKPDATSVETDASVGITSRGSVFKIAPNRTTDGRELATNLMVAPRMEVNLQ